MTDLDERLARMEAGEPACGLDLCDECGDCLRCGGADPCARWHFPVDDDCGLADPVDRHVWLAYSPGGEVARAMDW